MALRPLGACDAEGVWRYASDPEVARWTGWKVHASLEESRAYAAAAARSGSWPGVLGLFLREPPNFMAGVVAGRLMPDGTTVEMGWALARAWWGRGLAREAAWALAAALFADGRCGCLRAAASPRNTRSLALMRGLGMRPAGTERRGGWDLSVWQVARRDWRGQDR